MAKLNLDHLTTFKLVISRGSFSGAAEALGLSQPAVSLQIRQLEQTLQARLIERTSRGIRPTAAGMTLSEHCINIDAVINTTIESVSRHSDEITGTVTLGTGATVCIHLLPPLHRSLGVVMREDRIISRGMNEVLNELRRHFPTPQRQPRTMGVGD